VTPFEAYKAYLAIKLHFTDPGYDAFRYKMRVTASEEAFWKRNDRQYFEAASRKFKTVPALTEAIVACMVADKEYIRDVLEGDMVLEEFRKRRSALEYDFKGALHHLLRVTRNLECMFISNPKETYPVVIQEYLAGKLSIEVLVLLDRITKYAKRLQTEDTILWPDLKQKIIDYSPFVPGPVDKYKDIAVKVFTSA
jgi:hypothetical protein